MNNGQNGQPEGAYFTSGIGNLPSNQNQEVIPNLNIDESAWKTERDPRSIGGNVISSMEATITNQSSGQNPDMGAIFLVDPTEEPLRSTDKTRKTGVNPNVIRTDGERMTKETSQEIEQSSNRLSQTHNASDYYNEIRYDMMPANLGNSFGRELPASPDNSYNRKLAA